MNCHGLKLPFEAVGFQKGVSALYKVDLFRSGKPSLFIYLELCEIVLSNHSCKYKHLQLISKQQKNISKILLQKFGNVKQPYYLWRIN